MTPEELPPQAARVIQALSSSTTCTTSTVDSLRCLLVARDFEAPQLHVSKALRQPANSKPTAGIPKSTDRRPRKAPIVTVLEEPRKDRNGLSLQQKERVATQVVNVVLQSLTTALKDKALERHNKSATTTTISTGPSKLPSKSNKASSRQQPLAPRCVNRRSTSPDQAKPTLHPSTHHYVLSLKAQSECACIAFAFLSSFQAEKELKTNKGGLQLANGLSAFVGKIIALGFHDLAIRDVVLLKAMIDGTKTLLKDVEEPALAPELTKDILIILLKCSEAAASGPKLSLTIALHFHVLKMVAARPTPQLVETALASVVPWSTRSTVTLIQHQMTMDLPGSREKLAHQLEALSRLLFGLCPKETQTVKNEALLSNTNSGPLVIFRLQSLAFQIRAMSWACAFHEGDIAAEVLKPFAGCLSSFARTLNTFGTRSYQVCKMAVDKLLDQVQQCSDCPETSPILREQAFIEIYEQMADLARASSVVQDVEIWRKEANGIMTRSGISRTRKLSMNLRRAAGDLRSSADTGDEGVLTGQLTLLIRLLGGDVAGDVESCEDVLASIHSVRKSVVPLIHQDSSPDRASSSRISDTVKDLGERVLLQGTSSVSQCVEFISARIEKDKKDDREAQEAVDIASRYIESLVALSKRYFADSDRREEFSRCLQDCLSIVDSLERISCHLASVDVATRKLTTLRVNISNIYWSYFTHQREHRAEAKTLKNILDLSLEPIDRKSLQLQIASLLAPRLEQEGMLHEVGNHYGKAAKSYLRALHLLLTSSALKSLAEDAASLSPSQVFSERGRWNLLGRLLRAYNKAVLSTKAQCDHECVPIFDDDNIAIAARGLFLEQQITVFDALRISGGNGPQIHGVLRALASTVLTLYTKQSFPIRRLRAANQLLRIVSADPSVLPRACCDILYDVADISDYIAPSFDLGLNSYKSHLEASHRISTMLLKGAADATIISSSLEAWSSMVQITQDCDSLRRFVDDVPSFQAQLECLAQYLEGHNLGFEKLAALKLSAAVSEVAKPQQLSDNATRLSLLGVQYTRFGLSIEAGSVLQKAKKYLDMTEKSATDIVTSQWHLAYAEYSLSIGNLGISEQHLVQAGIMLRQSFEGEDSRKSNARSDQLALMSADSAKIHSELSFAQGKSLRALYFTRLAVKILRWAWTRAQTAKDTRDNRDHKKTAGTGQVGPLNSVPSPLVGTTFTPVREPLPNRRWAWTLIPRLFERLLELSTLYAHEGLLPEAQYYAEQAQEVAGNVTASNFAGRSPAQAGFYTVRGGDNGQTIAHFGHARIACQAHGHDFGQVDHQMFLAEKYTREKDFESAESAYEIANETLGSLTNRLFSLCKDSGLNEPALDTLMANLALGDVPRMKKIPDRRTRKTTKAPLPASSSIDKPDEAFTKWPVPLRARKASLLRQQAWTWLQAGNLEAAHESLVSTATQSKQPHQMIQQFLLQSQLCLRRALNSMATDLTFGVLQESTTSCPSLKQIHVAQGSVFEQAPDRKNKASRAKKTTVVAPAKGEKAFWQPHGAGFVSPLQRSQEILSQMSVLATQTASTTDAHAFVEVSARTLLMLSSLGSAVAGGNQAPAGVASVIELGRILASLKEKKTIQIERQLSLFRHRQQWLEKSCPVNNETNDHFDLSLELSTFLPECLEILPAAWTVVSLSLAESHNEIRISRSHSRRSPFTMSIPFNRHSSRDPDEETFSFDQAKAELQEIINLANYSTHDAPDPSRKGAKAAWWEARAALDARLKDLLANIESIWLGGFRAMFSPSSHESNLISRFQETLQSILDRNLPSRQKQTKSGKPPHMILDSQVIELFVGLGDPNATDLEEELTDLLYFIIDILQFHGETNAYDEIDFDAMIVEIQDALRSYHAAANDTISPAGSRHIILVLDKALHSFPWESLPCMKGQAVSRVPSLSFLQDRVLQQRARGSSDERFTVSPSIGTYVLNPSGDLTATQSRFEQPLANLTTWEPIVNREPTEAELETSLLEKDIFLYFGHGSGCQYIRPRTIKKLDKCAVALLMGCSSGKMTEAGLYESHGTPLNYMHAGSPAVLATLWDVTDKDIDRFSQEVLEKWGLFEQQTPEVAAAPARSPSPVKRGSPVKKSRQRTKPKETAARKTMSLDQAVAGSRDACIMKYLNGAAPVIYGVPVFLS